MLHNILMVCSGFIAGYLVKTIILWDFFDRIVVTCSKCKSEMKYCCRCKPYE